MIAEPIEIKQCEGFWNCISSDAYLQGISTIVGSILSAIIAATIAIYVLKRQFKYELERHEFKELEKFMKVGPIINAELKSLEDTINFLVNPNQENYRKDYDIYFLELEEGLKNLNEIDKSIIPTDLATTYNIILIYLQTLITLKETYYLVNDWNEIFKLNEQIKETYTKYLAKVQEFESLLELKMERYSKLIK